MASTQPRFVILDGVDGSGKTLQAERLCRAWTVEGRPAPLHLREPGSTALGERLRALLLESDVRAGAAAETLLFAAARRQMLDELVAPALAAGRDVVCERFHASTFAYQAVAGELDEELVLSLLEAWAGTPEPTRVVVLDLDARTASARRTQSADRIEARGTAYLERVVEGYRRYAERFGDLVRIVDASASPETVAARVLEVAS
ncbi:MAG: dTMP kinase [Planctomycetota bacterium]